MNRLLGLALLFSWLFLACGEEDSNGPGEELPGGDAQVADATADLPSGQPDLARELPEEGTSGRADATEEAAAPECEADGDCTPGVCDLGKCWPAPPAMVPVPAGEFWMGCDGVRDTQCEGNGLGGSFDQPYHLVTVPPFHIGRLEVTVADYAHCVAAEKCTAPLAEPECTWSAGTKSDLPVTCVVWEQARAYCEWREARLCTEAEWEVAARGACDTLTFTQERNDCEHHQWLNPWGNDPASCLVAVMNETGLPDDAGCGKGWPWPVGSRPDAASPYLVEDTVGNVGEWVEDCMEDSYEGAPVDGSARTACTWMEGQHRVHRGAGWTSMPWFLRAAQRGSGSLAESFTNVGIRCCRDQ